MYIFLLQQIHPNTGAVTIPLPPGVTGAAGGTMGSFNSTQTPHGAYTNNSSTGAPNGSYNAYNGLHTQLTPPTLPMPYGTTTTTGHSPYMKGQYGNNTGQSPYIKSQSPYIKTQSPYIKTQSPSMKYPSPSMNSAVSPPMLPPPALSDNGGIAGYGAAPPAAAAGYAIADPNANAAYSTYGGVAEAPPPPPPSSTGLSPPGPVTMGHVAGDPNNPYGAQYPQHAYPSAYPNPATDPYGNPATSAYPPQMMGGGDQSPNKRRRLNPPQSAPIGSTR